MLPRVKQDDDNRGALNLPTVLLGHCSFAASLDCTITVDPAVKKPITLRVVDQPASDILSMISRSIECEYRFDGRDLLTRMESLKQFGPLRQ
jgi:hypothetical protein